MQGAHLTPRLNLRIISHRKYVNLKNKPFGCLRVKHMHQITNVRAASLPQRKTQASNHQRAGCQPASEKNTGIESPKCGLPACLREKHRHRITKVRAASLPQRKTQASNHQRAGCQPVSEKNTGIESPTCGLPACLRKKHWHRITNL